MPPGRVNDPPASPAKIQSAIDGQIYLTGDLPAGSLELGDLVIFNVEAGLAVDVCTADKVKKFEWDGEWDPVLDYPGNLDKRPRWVTELARNRKRSNKPE